MCCWITVNGAGRRESGQLLLLSTLPSSPTRRGPEPKRISWNWYGGREKKELNHATAAEPWPTYGGGGWRQTCMAQCDIWSPIWHRSLRIQPCSNWFYMMNLSTSQPRDAENEIGQCYWKLLEKSLLGLRYPDISINWLIHSFIQQLCTEYLLCVKSSSGH